MVVEYANPRDRANAALVEFRRRVPMMTGFAKSITGDQGIQIMPTAGGSFTDGSVIYLEVPIAMADIGNHGDRKNCGLWDSRGIQMCGDCGIVDDLNYSLFHEISHIWGNSFANPGSSARVRAVEVVEEYLPSGWAPEPEVYRGIIRHSGNDTWLKIGGRIAPFLGELVNVFEDARVNEKMANVRPGVRAWRRACEERILDEGIRRFDPRLNEIVILRHSNASLNAQMAYALYFLASGVRVPREFDPYVIKATADERVMELAAESVGNLDPGKVFEFSVRAYGLMCEMGFFGNEPKPDESDTDEDESQEGVAPLNEEGSEGDRDRTTSQKSSQDDNQTDEGGDPEGTEESESESDASSEGGSEDDSLPSEESDSIDEGSESSDSGQESNPEGDSDESTDGDREESSSDGEGSPEDSSESKGGDEFLDSESKASDGGDDSTADGEVGQSESESDSTEGTEDSGEFESASGAPQQGESSSEDEASNAPEGEDGVDCGISEDEGGNATGGSDDVQDADQNDDLDGGCDGEDVATEESNENADQAPGSEHAGRGEDYVESEVDEADSGNSGVGDEESDESSGPDERASHTPGGSEGGEDDSNLEDEADDIEGESEAGSEACPQDESTPERDDHGTRQQGDSTEGEREGGDDFDREGSPDGESTDESVSEVGGEGAESDDCDGEEGSSERGESRPNSGESSNSGLDDPTSPDDATGESHGGEGTHGEGGPSSGVDGSGTSNVSEEDVSDSSREREEPVEPPEDSQDEAIPPAGSNWGDVKEVHDELEELLGHHSPNEGEDREVIEELEHIISIGDVFDSIPRNVSQVWWNRWERHYKLPNGADQATSWTHDIGPWYWFASWPAEQIGIKGDFRVPDSTIGKALMRARVAFADNARKREVRNIKSGRVNAASLGKRAPIHDPRLFKKVARPGKRDYFVVIGLDLSASTTYAPHGSVSNLALIKRSAMAQCEVLSRLGVKFAVYGHSAKYIDGQGLKVALNMYVVKDARDPWNEQTRLRLERLGPDEGNLDGHTLQLYRKLAEKESATDKILMYYTDGEIPALNGEEEKEVLLGEIGHCRKVGIALMGVGVRTDSLAEFGFDYVRVDEDGDLVKVVESLEKRLTK